MMRKFCLYIWMVSTILCISYCSDKPNDNPQTETSVQDSLARPQDVGEHKSIHQEEWEYYRQDSSNADYR